MGRLLREQVFEWVLVSLRVCVPLPTKGIEQSLSLQKDIEISRTRQASKESFRLIGISMEAVQFLENIVQFDS
jgi:hypothetical protein